MFARKVGGLEYSRMVMRGKVPRAPVCELVGFRFVLMELGEIGIEFDPAEYHYNVIGSVTLVGPKLAGDGFDLFHAIHCRSSPTLVAPLLRHASYCRCRSQPHTRLRMSCSCSQRNERPVM